MIKARDVAFEYNRRDNDNNVVSIERALDGVDFDIKPGEFVSIIGHNGSGKSTLAKHLNALITPTEGTVWVDSLDTSDEMNTLKIRQTTGMVFQNPDNQIIADVVEEDVAFGPENMGVPTEEIWERVNKSLMTVDMLERRSDSPNHLSGGQKQRVAIAGVLAMKPRCIVLDEPTAMLDPAGRRDVIDAVTKLNKKEGINIILITHYMEEIIHSDRVFVMNKGKIVMEGSPSYIFERAPELEEYGLGIPAVTRIAHILRNGNINIPADVLSPDELADCILEKFRSYKFR